MFYVYFIPTGFILRNGFMLLPIFCSDGAAGIGKEMGLDVVSNSDRVQNPVRVL